MEVAILGGGNFGTAVANIVASNGTRTHLWMRNPEQVADVVAHRENRRYLPGHRLHDNLVATSDLCAAVQRSTLVVVCVPSASFRDVCVQLKPHVRDDGMFVSATKGIEADGFRLMSQVLAEVTGARHIGALSGPNLAEEMAAGQYTGTVIASQHELVRDAVQEVMSSETFRVYGNDDLYGVELGGALKNIYAIVCGMAAGIGVGQNTQGMLITRALAEMSRLAVSMGANPFTFLGLAGVGDLMVTCSSPLSRNYRLGYRIGQGMTLDEALDDLGKLAEGVNTLRVVRARCAEEGVYMPLAEGLYRILFEARPLAEVIRELMTGSRGVDVEFASPAQWQGAHR